MKKWCNVLLACFCVLLSANIVLAENNAYTGGITQEFRTGYLGSGGFLFSNRPVSQTDAFIAYNGFRAEVWLSTNLDGNFRTNDGSEIDWILGYNHDITMFGHKINMDVGIAYFDCPKMFSNESFDTIEPFVEFQLLTDTAFTPFVRGEFNFFTDGGNANTFFVGTYHQFKITDAFAINSKIAGVFDLGEGRCDAGTILLFETGLGWKYNDTLTFSPLFVKATVPLYGGHERNGFESIVGMKLSYTF